MKVSVAMRMKPLLSAAALLLGALLVSWAVGLKSDVAELRAELSRVRAATDANAEASPKELRLARVERLRLARETISANPISLKSTAGELQQARHRIAELEGLVSELSDSWNQFTEDEESRRAAAVIQEWNAQQAASAPDNALDGAR